MEKENKDSTEVTRGRRRVTLLVILSVVLTLAAAGLLGGVIYLETHNDDNDTNDLCVTKDCVMSAVQVFGALDTSVDPCEDFYNFACGGWMKKNRIPDDASSFGTFVKLEDELQQELRDILEEPITDKDIDSEKKTKRLYLSCINEAKMEKLGLQPVRDVLAEMGGWPVLNKTWTDAKFNLTELLVHLRMRNNDLLMAYGVTVDDKNPENQVLYFDQMDLGLSRNQFMGQRDSAVLTLYEKLAVDMAVMLGATEPDAKKDMKDVIDFEVDFAKITIPPDDLRDPASMYHKIKLGELDSNTTLSLPYGMKWFQFMQLLFDQVNITINATNEAMIYHPNYITDMTKLVNKTPKRVVNNYLIFRFLRHRLFNLPKQYRHLADELGMELSGAATQTARWKDCVDYVNNDILMGDVTGRMFITRYFDQKAKQEARDLVKHLRSAFAEIMSKADWMDSETKKLAEEKLAAIDEKIAFDNKLLNGSAVDYDNEEWDFKEDQYFANVMTVLRHYAIGGLQSIEASGYDNTGWTTTPGVVNAFYSPSYNRITFPAGILQPPFYGKRRPKFLNYGGIGTVMGHEMTHGFDDEGRAYDKDGALNLWWTDASLKEFTNRAQCLVDQYGAFKLPELNGAHVHGDLTLGENIADNGGMKISYRAYETYVEKNGEEKTLPGIKLTNRQLVFVAFAQSFCSKSKKADLNYLINNDPHSPGRYRIKGTLSNNAEFARQFQCKKGSAMNPEKKCSVW